MRILILDDDRNYLEMIKEYITTFSHDVDLADNVEEAKQLLASSIYDKVLVDVRMPEMSGVDFINSFSDKYPYTKFYILTADPGYINSSCSCNGVILKNSIMEGLKSVVLERRHQEVH